MHNNVEGLLHGTTSSATRIIMECCKATKEKMILLRQKGWSCARCGSKV